MKALTRTLTATLLLLALSACDESTANSDDPQLTVSDGSASDLNAQQAALAQAMGEDGPEVLDALAQEADETPIDKPAILKRKSFFLAITWGHLRHPKHGPLQEAELIDADAKPDAKPDAKKSPPGEVKPMAKKATHWTGFVETNAKKLGLVRTIRFEKNDEVLPCIDGECLGVDTITLGGMDGILVRVTARLPKPDGKKQTVRVVLSNSKGADLDILIPLHELPGLHEVKKVDESGNRVALRGFARKPGACPHGRMKGRVKAHGPKRALMVGAWKSADGDRIGHVVLKAHKTGAKKGKFVGAFTGADGMLRGVLRGRFHAVPLGDDDTHLAKLARFRGKAFGPDGEVIGFVRGAFFRTKNGKSGFRGQWRRNCRVERRCNPCEDALECADQTDADGLAKPEPAEKKMCGGTQIIAMCSAKGCELTAPQQRHTAGPMAGPTSLFTFTKAWPEKVSLRVQVDDMVLNATDLIDATHIEFEEGHLVRTSFNTADLPWEGAYPALYTSTIHAGDGPQNNPRLSDTIGALTVSSHPEK